MSPFVYIKEIVPVIEPTQHEGPWSHCGLLLTMLGGKMLDAVLLNMRAYGLTVQP